MKTVVIVQSFYIPWKGYFDRLGEADEVILYDDMQYQRRFWINRNQIKTVKGLHWLTVPVEVKGRFKQTIKDTRIADKSWAQRHWETIQRSYAKAAYFPYYRDRFEEIFLGCREVFISRINYRFLCAINEIVGLNTTLTWSMDYRLVPGKTERLVDLCRQAGADVYLSGPTARDYIQENLFQEAGIELRYMDYKDYPEYPQLYPPFRHEVSILDLIFNTGPKASEYMKSFARRK